MRCLSMAIYDGSNMNATQLDNHTASLVELVRDGHQTWTEAVMEFRSEFKCSLLYCIDIGLVKRLQAVDKDWKTTKIEVKI